MSVWSHAPAGALVLLFALWQSPDYEKGIKDKSYEVRLATVQVLAKDTDPRTEHFLVTAARDADWEVALKAVDGLAERGTKQSLDPMVKLALEGPILRLRQAAARAVAHISPEEGATALLRKTQGDDARIALEGVAIVLAGRETKIDLASSAKLAEKAKDPAVREAAARAVAAASWKGRDKALAKILDGPYVRATCAALDAMAANPQSGDLERALAMLQKTTLDDCVERRATWAVESAVRAATGDVDVTRIVDALKPLVSAKDGAVSARGVRILARLATPPAVPAPLEGAPPPAPKPAFLSGEIALEALKPAVAHAGEDARAAAAHALAHAGPTALDTVRNLAKSDKSARVRRAALESMNALQPVSEEPNRTIVIERLAKDDDSEVRRTAAVLLGRRGLTEAVEPLTAATADRDWTVAVCAAVSLGKTQAGSAVDPLAKIIHTSTDWKMRGAAVAGLSRLYLKSAIPPAIDALTDADGYVVQSAYSFLLDVSRQAPTQTQPSDTKREPWLDWWKQNESRILLVDPVTQAEFRKRFQDSGTAAPEIFRNMDVVVLESRGDHIESVLAGQKIEHRLTMAGKVTEARLSCDGLFVANCTGEIENPDIERLRWFVLVGGHLFSSCWALHETIEKVMPGVLMKHETRDEVVANVEARDCSLGSPYLEGVFGDGVQPIYALEGAHLIDVIDPERAEVLIDSPESAETYGCGNMAAWFQAGHGTVLDSVNHYEAQGLETAMGLKKPEDRQVYAVDHMGLSLEKLRAVKNESWWDSSAKASKQVTDLSVFHLVTNFVRLRRMAL